jgi:hypothetical protein
MIMKTFAQIASLVVASLGAVSPALAGVGVGAKPIAGAEVILDGSREMLDQKWTYWEGPRFSSSMPIKWKVVDDPVVVARPFRRLIGRRPAANSAYTLLRRSVDSRPAPYITLSRELDFARVAPEIIPFRQKPRPAVSSTPAPALSAGSPANWGAKCARMERKFNFACRTSCLASNDDLQVHP